MERDQEPVERRESGAGGEGFLRRHRRPLLGAIVGGIGGAVYAATIGCRTGQCALTSSPWTAALYFGLVGAIALLPPAKPRGDR